MFPLSNSDVTMNCPKFVCLMALDRILKFQETCLSGGVTRATLHNKGHCTLLASSITMQGHSSQQYVLLLYTYPLIWVITIRTNLITTGINCLFHFLQTLLIFPPPPDLSLVIACNLFNPSKSKYQENCNIIQSLNSFSNLSFIFCPPYA